MDYSKLTDEEILKLGKESGLVPEKKLIYPSDFFNKVICGDNVEVMKNIPDNSIDTIVTDPPYGLSFMGKKWDYDVPSVDTWKECLRVLKPGGTALIFAGSRTQHRMAVNVEDAGFILKDCIEYFVNYDWIDFYNSLNRDQQKIFSNLTSDNKMFWIVGSGFPKATDISKQLDKGHKRKIVGIDRTKQRPNAKESRAKDNAVGKFGMMGDAGQTTEPFTEEAKLWEGWKSHGLKPAYEPILIATKQNDGTYANNALKWGVSGLNIDGGRIDYLNKKDKGDPKRFQKTNGGVFLASDPANTEVGIKGRFPANIILDNEAGKLLDEQSGISNGDNPNRKPRGNIPTNGVTQFGTSQNPKPNRSDKGGASRFFKNIPLDSRMIYVPKASKSERNKGLKEKQELSLRPSGIAFNDHSGIHTEKKKGNFHLTVKPLKLMQYLCTLTKTPTGGIVLDPFTGSGTTGLACKNLGRDFIGIEKEEEYCKIAKRRIGEIK